VKRASYREAIRWIAYNDSAADDGALNPTTVSELVSAVLVADLFGVTTTKVGEDVVRERRREFKHPKCDDCGHHHASFAGCT
jgi:hypothetical protein